MLKSYNIKDNKFNPQISREMYNTIIESLNNSVSTTSKDSKGYKIIKLLADLDETKESEVILAYEILYNIYLDNTDIDEIVRYIENNQYSVDFSALEAFFIDNSLSGGLYKKYAIWSKYRSSQVEISKTSLDLTFPTISKKNGEININDYINNFDSLKIPNIHTHETDLFTNFVDLINYSTKYTEYKPIESFMFKANYDLFKTSDNGIHYFRNEREAFEAYYDIMVEYQTDPVNKNDPSEIGLNPQFITYKMMEELFPVKIDKFSNVSTIPSASILQLPSIKNYVYESTTENNFLKWIMNFSRDTKNESINAKISKGDVDQCLDWLFDRTIETIDSYNRSIDTLREDIGSAVNQLVIEYFEGLGTNFINYFYNNAAEIINNSDFFNDKITLREDVDIDRILSVLKGSLQLYMDLPDRKILYWEAFPNNFLLKETYDIVTNEFLKATTIGGIKDWKRVLFLIIEEPIFYLHDNITYNPLRIDKFYLSFAKNCYGFYKKYCKIYQYIDSYKLFSGGEEYELLPTEE